MFIYLLTQDENTGYDTHDSAVVVAPDEEAAKRLDPYGYYRWSDERGGWLFQYADGRQDLERHGTWANDLDNIGVECVGTADPKYTEPTVLLASFNAG